MKQNRREFLKLTGVATIAATGGLGVAQAEVKPAANNRRGMARGLTLLTMRRNGEYRLGVKTNKGILDVKEAAGGLKMGAPATMDELLQNEDGPRLNALVDAALKSNAVAHTFLKEEAVEYGPVVVQPEKIIGVGINSRRHAKDVNLPIQKRRRGTSARRMRSRTWQATVPATTSRRETCSSMFA
ncbi:MAG: twin-arginine translocation signal domain-containing protein [Candidatus Korobacteraceae bacterium]